MRDLSQGARELLDLGRDAGEPDDAALARGRASLMKRVGIATVAATTVTAVATTAKAAPIAAVAAPVAVVAPVTAAAVIPVAAIPLVGVPLIVKIVAAAAIVVGVSVGAKKVVFSGSKAESPKPAIVSVETPAEVAAPTPIVARVPTKEDVPVAPMPVASAAVPRATETWAPAPTQPRALAPVAAASPSAKLAEDVASLREAQEALVAGNPSRAMAAATRIQPSGPLAEEREGVAILAACALGTGDARGQAESFVLRHAEAPIAVRVRAACGLSEK